LIALPYERGYYRPDNHQLRTAMVTAILARLRRDLWEMVKSPWVYRRLRNFRAGIEATISCFKRTYGGSPKPAPFT